MSKFRTFLERKGITTFEGAGKKDFLIECPFHDDGNPSLEVHKDTGIFHCFGCKESGPFSKLIAKIDGVDIATAKKELAAGESVDNVLGDIEKLFEGDEDSGDGPLKYFSIKAFHKSFKPVADTPGEAYLEGRGISRDTAKRFDIRFADTGLMKDRVILPVYTSKGKLLTYTGRAISDSIQPKTRKPRSGLSEIYGLHEVLKRWDRPEKLPYLILTEGEFDAIWLGQNGYNAGSIMGTAKLRSEQLTLLWRHTKLVIWSLDGDNAGRRAQTKAMEMTKRYLPTVSVSLPEGRDPNDLSVHEINEIYGDYIQ